MHILTAIGNITQDATLKFMPKGDAVLTFNLAVNSGYGDKKIATFYRCSLFGKRAETLAPMLLKGTKIGVSGEPTNRPYTAKDGAEKLSLEVRVNDLTLLGGKPAANEGGNSNTHAAQNKQPQAQPEGAKAVGFDDFEDDVPF